MMAKVARKPVWCGAMFSPGRSLVLSLIGFSLFAVSSSFAQEIENEPIKYSAATHRNAVSRLEERLASGSTKLEFDSKHGYLESLLKALEVPTSSQVLVFSKTSFQRERISPRTPRAIYFNDEVMIGFCLHGPVMEISAADETIGTAYYTLDQTRDEKPRPVRQTDSCLICHSSSANQGIPGHLVRSVFVDRDGQPLLASGSFRTDHSSPLAERWGGWYVTGTSGRQKHMGNLVCEGQKRPEDVDNSDGVNVLELKGRFPASRYLSPHSDIIALLVLEHQVGMLNRLARAAMETRMALHYEREINKALGRPENEPSESARSRIRGVGDAVVRYMLFAEEVRLTDRVKGTSTFASDFAARGPRDSKGRSLRDFDLKTRLFRFPCSYLVYSRAFDSLPSAVKEHVYQRLWEILASGQAKSGDPVLSIDDREAIVEILRDTKPDLPEFWRAPRPRSNR
jgi:hypothetical protein